MKRLVCVALLALAAAFPVAAEDKVAEAGCTPRGTWVGTTLDGKIVMTITYGHESAQTGTVVIDLPSFDATQGGTLRVSSAARGIWRKTGGNTWDYVALIVVSVPGGDPVYVAKISGPVTASEHCTSLLIKTRMELYLPAQNPFTDDPIDEPVDLADHGAFPMVLDAGPGK